MSRVQHVLPLALVAVISGCDGPTTVAQEAQVESAAELAWSASAATSSGSIMDAVEEQLHYAVEHEKRHPDDAWNSQRTGHLRSIVARWRAQGVREPLAGVVNVETGDYSFEASSYEVDEPGTFGYPTLTWVTVGSSSNPPKIVSYSTVTLPAIIDHKVSGNVKVGDLSYPIRVDKSSFPLFWVGPFETEIPLSMTDCNQGTQAAATTHHIAGWQVKGWGMVMGNTFTNSSATCSCSESGDEPQAQLISTTQDPSARVVTTSSDEPSSCSGTDAGGGDNPMPTCVTIITDYYFWYPDTGQVEYRYSTTATYCNMQ